MQLADSLNRLGTETAFEVLARAKALEASGRRIIHLQIGEPDFTTPRHIIDAGRKAWADGETHYCPAPGLPVLREACAAHLSRHRGLEIDPGNVVVAPGAKPFLFFGVLATCNPGDEVIYPNPGFPIYESVIKWAGATPVPLPITEDRDFAFSVDDLAERLTPKTKLVILNSPANPTGGIVPRELNVQMAKLLADHDCWILSDEVYSEMLYEGAHDTIASHEGLLERTILLDGFSKTFAMTGWRLGYAALPKPLVEPITRLIINSVSCTAPAVQLAGVAALEGPRDEVNAMMAEFTKRREFVVDGLNKLPGVELHRPERRLLRLPERQGDRPRHARAGRTGCSTRPASRCSRARPSASTARATCASPTRTRSRTSRRRCRRWATCSRRRPPDGGPHRRHGPRARAGARPAARGRRARRAHAGDGARRSRSCTRRSRAPTPSSRCSATASTTPSSTPPGRSCASSRTSPWATTTSTSPPARARGVLVTNTPGVLTDATADIAMALILMVMRRLGEGERVIRSRRRLALAHALHARHRACRARRSASSASARSAPRPRAGRARSAWRSSTAAGGAPTRRSRPSSAPRFVDFDELLGDERRRLAALPADARDAPPDHRRAPAPRCAATPTSSTRRAGPSSTRPRSPRRCAAA